MLGLTVAACAGSDPDIDSARAPEVPTSDQTAPVDTAETVDSEGTTEADDGQTTETTSLWDRYQNGSTPADPPPSPISSAASCEPGGSPAPSSDFESVTLEDLGETDGVRVHAAEYPLPDYEGNPWSQWGEGVALPDGRYVSAVGDHLGQDGTTWFYEYDPATDELTRTVEVSEFLDHEDGDWGFGKIHAPMVLDADCSIVTATYWGSRRGIEDSSYEGDHLVRYDPITREVHDLGIPVEGFGIPSLSISPDRRYIYGEAVDPSTDAATEADTGVFFIADAATGEVTHLDDRDEHVGFRDVLVTSDGEALYAMNDGSLGAVRPDGAERVIDAVLPGGGWLRSATPTRGQGAVYGVTRDPDALFEYSTSGESIDMGELEGYVASIALSPDGETVFYVPGAHGNGPELGGTPLIAVDTASGERTVLARLNDVIEPALGVVAGGSFSVVAAPSGDRIYVGLNGGRSGSDEEFGTVVLAAIDLS